MITSLIQRIGYFSTDIVAACRHLKLCHLQRLTIRADDRLRL